jgi:hypothetical protein
MNEYTRVINLLLKRVKNDTSLDDVLKIAKTIRFLVAAQETVHYLGQLPINDH